MDIWTFDEAIEHSDGIKGKRHLLLGNGFSIACRHDCFAYGKLFDEADFSQLSIDAPSLFALSGTTDFERAIESLRISKSILDLYAGDTDLIKRLESDAEALKQALANVLALKHPDVPSDIDPAEFGSARDFLEHFDGGLYTVNYDMLLYWTLMQDEGPEVPSDDGFRNDPDDQDAEWVVWDGFAAHDQRVFYLHGGLHLFDAGSALKKITWGRTGIPLLDQIRDSLDRDHYPHVVTEGTSDEKLRRIEHSPYLHRGLKSMQAAKGKVFIHGHSLAANDAHVLRRIEEGKVTNLYISLHGDPSSDDNEEIQRRARGVVDKRVAHEEGKADRYKTRLEVGFYDADTAEVWTRRVT